MGTLDRSWLGAPLGSGLLPWLGACLAALLGLGTLERSCLGASLGTWLSSCLSASLGAWLAALLWGALGFAAGAIPFGVLVARRLGGVDIQAHGSGNIGATNVTRVLGVVPGLIVLVLDAAKGALPLAAALRWSGDLPIALLTGGAAILGHCFSPFLGFRGGKGVATAFGVFLVLAPPLAAIAVVVFAVVLAVTRVPALGSLAGIASISVALFWQHEYAVAGFAVGTTLLLFYTHRSNLAKLRRSNR